MENNNNPFIKGGLPLNEDDFANKENASKGKSDLLASLRNINRVHKQKMNEKVEDVKFEVNESQLRQDVENSFSDDAVGITVDMLNQDNKDFVDDKIEEVPTYINYEQEQLEQPEQPVQPDISEYATSDFSAFPSEEFIVDEGQGDYQQQGEPMYVMNDSDLAENKKPEVPTKKGRRHREPRQSNSSIDDIRKGRGVAWLAYILFFIPLLFKGKNPYVRFHANEGLLINIIDILGAGLICVGHFITSINTWLHLALMISMILGIIVICLTTITKLFMIIASFAGKEVETPWLGRIQIIK